MGATSQCYSVLSLLVVVLVLVTPSQSRPTYVCSSPSEAIEGEYIVTFAQTNGQNSHTASVDAFQAQLDQFVSTLERENTTDSDNETAPAPSSPTNGNHNSTYGYGNHNSTNGYGHRNSTYGYGNHNSTNGYGHRRVYGRNPRLSRFRHLGRLGAAKDCSSTHLNQLLQSELFSHVECNLPVHVTARSWGIDRVTTTRWLPMDGIAGYQALNQRGAGVHIAIVDTGINVEHTEFAAPDGWTTPTYSGISLMSGTRIAAENAGSKCFSDSCDTIGITDGHGHGTHTSGTAAGLTFGLAPDAVIHAIAVLNPSGSGTNTMVIEGINYVTELKTTTGAPFVMSMSLGSSYSASVNAAVQNAIDNGVVVVTAAGNSAMDASYFSPSSVTQAITVAATYSNDTRAEWSNYGSYVDIYAPGVYIISSWIGSSTAAAILSGTSMATPHVTGAVAMYMSQTGTNPTNAAGVVAVGGAIVTESNAGFVKKNVLGTPNVLLYAPCRNGECCNSTGELGGTGTCSQTCGQCTKTSDVCASTSNCAIDSGCAVTTCVNGQCTTTPKPAQTSCAPDGADSCSRYACDGQGTCVVTQTANGVSCGNSSVCATYQCQSGTCTLTRTFDGTNCGTAKVCYSAPVCSAGSCPTSVPLAVGTPCSGTGALGTCQSYQCSSSHTCVIGHAPVGTPCRLGIRSTGHCNSSGGCS